MKQETHHFVYQKIDAWPKLAWVVMHRQGSSALRVLHGPCVETAADWFVEGAWSGDFGSGDFHEQEVMAGTGVRLSDQGVLFVNTSDSMGRLHHYTDGGVTHVSNALPALLATTGVGLLAEHDYPTELRRFREGPLACPRSMPASKGSIGLAYFNNLLLTHEGIREVPRHEVEHDFPDFESYRTFLFETARRLGANLADRRRCHQITPVVAMSQGYDSAATAVIAKEAGTKLAFTMTTARREPGRLLDANDSGEPVAKQIGLSCRSYSRYQDSYPCEDAVWAVTGDGGDLNMCVFDYPQPLSLLFNGYLGDLYWDPQRENKGFLRRSNTGGLRFTEARLELGVFATAPAAWAPRAWEQINALGKRPELDPWRLNTDYDRPIPRRLAEDAGIRRGTFGIRKKATTFSRKTGGPHSDNLREEFATFLEKHGEKSVSKWGETVSLGLRAVDKLVLEKLPRPLRFSVGSWIKLPERQLFFMWATERRRARYLQTLDETLIRVP